LRYRQPGSLCTPQNFAQSSKFLGFFRAFLSIFQNLKVPASQQVFQEAHERNFDLSRSFERFLGVDRSWLCCAPVDGLTKNVIKQNV
jgi:hypothetical protein